MRLLRIKLREIYRVADFFHFRLEEKSGAHITSLLEPSPKNFREIAAFHGFLSAKAMSDLPKVFVTVNIPRSHLAPLDGLAELIILLLHAIRFWK